LFSDIYPKYSYLPAQKKITTHLLLQAELKDRKGKRFFGIFNNRD